jgi:gamma-D-glutamyl-L-lysine dipeptidyl-peptidase
VTTDVLTRCATVRVAIAPMHLEPQISSVQISQQLAGAPVEILDDRDDWMLVCGDDRYQGWVHRGYLVEGEAARLAGERARLSLGCVVTDSRGSRRALPLRAYLAGGERVESGETIEARMSAERFPAAPAAIVESAQRYFVGTSYLWGGVTPWGADCSGYAQSIFALHGVMLPRDAWQQAHAGEPGTRDILDARPAELLFFSDRADRKITHVAVSLGDRRIAHCALGRGGFGVEQLDAVSDGYVVRLRERFLFGRRVL